MSHPRFSRKRRESPPAAGSRASTSIASKRPRGCTRRMAGRSTNARWATRIGGHAPQNDHHRIGHARGLSRAPRAISLPDCLGSPWSGVHRPHRTANTGFSQWNTQIPFRGDRRRNRGSAHRWGHDPALHRRDLPYSRSTSPRGYYRRAPISSAPVAMRTSSVPCQWPVVRAVDRREATSAVVRGSHGTLVHDRPLAGRPDLGTDRGKGSSNCVSAGSLEGRVWPESPRHSTRRSRHARLAIETERPRSR